ncbi:late histone H1 [Nematostella vectensis]|uniref:late histone H1 n=1 Tax=Nematostella vectensis TaxID=45351 RepID=UPI0013901244|nr:late histone H1 [Nematostella vectensis]
MATKTDTPTHPKYVDMISSAVKNLGGKGASRQAINKYIVKEFNLTENKHHHTMLNQALKRASAPEGTLVHNKGKGAAGSFKLRAATPAKAAPKKTPAKKSAKKPAPSVKKTAPNDKTKAGETPKAAGKKTAKPAKAKRGKKSKAASPKKPKVVRAKKSLKKPAKAAAKK